MNKIVMCMVLILSITMLGGCNEKTESSQKENTKAEAEIDTESGEKKEMTQQQEEIFRSYGLKEEEITKMKKKGLDYSQQSFVDTAIIMLNYLEEKYGEKFQVVSGDIPGIFSGAYWIKAEACEGEYAGEEFDVYFEGELGCRDGYIVYKKQDEACEALKDLIQGQFPEVQVFTSIHGEYGNEITLDMTGEQLLQIVSYYYDLIITDPKMTQEEFEKKVKDIETYLDGKNVFSSGSVFCCANEVDSEMTMKEITIYIKSHSDSNDVIIWNDYISTH